MGGTELSSLLHVNIFDTLAASLEAEAILSFAGDLSNLAIPIDCFEHLGAVSLFVCTGLP